MDVDNNAIYGLSGCSRKQCNLWPEWV